MHSEVLRKLDAGLLSLVMDGGFDEAELVPVFITVAEGELERLCGELEEAGGRVRHVMGRFGAVAVWIPLGLVQEFAARPAVHGLEMSQPVEVA